MNIKILDSWLREYLKTDATPEKIGECLSLTSVGVERIANFGKNDFVYDIEVTTNRPDLMSVISIAREAAAVLSEFGMDAKFKQPVILARNRAKSKSITNNPNVYDSGQARMTEDFSIEIKNNPSLVRRICAVVMEVNLKESPQYIKDRLESSDIRSLTNVIDITNYVMREIGHPTHIFDYDRITTHRLEIRESRPNEKIKTLDGHEYKLPGGDIVADDGLGHIVDLLGIMGLENSVVTNDTKRILYFIDTVEPHHIRKTSMITTIRTEAAVLNEKGIDPELAKVALLRGIELYQKIADAKILSDIIDIYPDPVKISPITVHQAKINRVIGVELSVNQSAEILKKLGFDVKLKGQEISATPPSWRADDIQIEEDIIEEIARIHGYHRLPVELPPVQLTEAHNMTKNPFYWENRVKDALKYWGFTEVYTYSLVGPDLLEGPEVEAVKLKNPVSSDMVYMRKTLVPSLLQVLNENKSRDEIKIFEIANVYNKRRNDLPEEVMMIAGVIKKPKINFYEIKGIIETMLADIGIKDVRFEPTTRGGEGCDVILARSRPESKNIPNHPNVQDSGQARMTKILIGEIEILEENIIDFELCFDTIIKHANLSKKYTQVAKFPPVIEDMRFEIPDIAYTKIVETIQKQSDLIHNVSLLDTYNDKKTFRITYQNSERNLTTEDVAPIRDKIVKAIEKLGGKAA